MVLELEREEILSKSILEMFSVCMCLLPGHRFLKGG